MKYAIAAIAALFMTGCASDGGNLTMGDRAEEKMLTDNTVKGMYLFKAEFNTNTITINSKESVKVGL